jgi:hypothetical protein
MTTNLTTRAAAPPPALPAEPQLASPALRLMLDDKLFDRAKVMAKYMSEAAGFIPKHLIGRPEACFAVVNRSLVWNLDPYAVAACTYQTPNGSIGYEGKLVAAVLEASGRIVGGLEHEHFGDWARIQGKFRKNKSAKGFEYAVPDWKPEDEVGLGVEISAQLRGEAKPRRYRMLLVQAYPRNSTLWALDPMTQLVYLATRRFANLRVPNLFMGLPFDREDLEEIGPDNARDVTPPRPTRADFPSEGGSAPKTKPAPLPADEPRDDRDLRPAETAAAAAGARGDREATAAERSDGGDHVTGDGRGAAHDAAASPSAGAPPVDEAAEREADRLMARAARGPSTDEDEDNARAEFAVTPIPLKKGGDAPDWIKWHTLVAAAAKSVPADQLAAFLAAHEPALENYAAMSPGNAKALRALILGAAS